MKIHTHIGYGDSATDCLNASRVEHNLYGDEAIPSRDDFTQGPISECLNENGTQQRIAYWESIENVLDNGMDVNAFYHQSIQLLKGIDADQITLWIGDSCHDILATGWLFSFFKDKSIEWFLIDLAKVDTEDFPVEVPAVNLAMYTPEQLPKLWKYRTPAPKDLQAHYIAIFQKAALENGPYRILQNQEIKTVEQDYYDQYILSFLSQEFVQTRTIIGNILRDGAYRISDTTIEWNIRKMIDQNRIEYRGQLDQLANYSIRLK